MIPPSPGPSLAGGVTVDSLRSFYYGVLPFMIGSGLRLAPRAALPWGGPAAKP